MSILLVKLIPHQPFNVPWVIYFDPLVQKSSSYSFDDVLFYNLNIEDSLYHLKIAQDFLCTWKLFVNAKMVIWNSSSSGILRWDTSDNGPGVVTWCERVTQFSLLHCRFGKDNGLLQSTYVACQKYFNLHSWTRLEVINIIHKKRYILLSVYVAAFVQVFLNLILFSKLAF